MRRISRSFRNAAAGLGYCFRTQPNMVIHAFCGAAALVLAALFRVEAVEWLLLLAAICAVTVAEVFNTALEKMVDLATREQNRLARIAKDVAAGAVLLTALFALAVGAVVFLPYLWQCFGGHPFFR